MSRPLALVVLLSVSALLPETSQIAQIHPPGPERSPSMIDEADALIALRGEMTIPTTTSTTAPQIAPETTRLRPAPNPRPKAPPRPQTMSGDVRTGISSTAYCLTGNMASGRPTYEGAAAMNGVPIYSQWRVSGGPMNGRTFTVEDRMGSGSGFDVAMPGRCDAARAYGRQTIGLTRVA